MNRGTENTLGGPKMTENGRWSCLSHDSVYLVTKQMWRGLIIFSFHFRYYCLLWELEARSISSITTKQTRLFQVTTRPPLCSTWTRNTRSRWSTTSDQRRSENFFPPKLFCPLLALFFSCLIALFFRSENIRILISCLIAFFIPNRTIFSAIIPLILTLVFLLFALFF